MDTPDLSSVTGGISAGQQAIVGIAVGVVGCGILVWVVPLAARYAVSLFSQSSGTSAKSSGPSNADVYKYWRASGHSPKDMQKMSGGWRNL